MSNMIRSRKFRGGAYATATSFLVILVLIVVNLISGSLFKQFDVTSTRKYSLADDTVNFVKSVDTPIDIYYVTAEGEEDLIIKTGAEQIAAANDKFTFTVKDPIQYPQFVYRYNKMQDITNNSIIVVNGNDPDRFAYIDSEDMKIYSINTQTYQQELYGYDAEVEIAKAIVEVTQDKRATVCITTNHGEWLTSLDSERPNQVTETLSDLLKLNAFKYRYVNLSTEGTVPADCDILLIGSPTSDFSAEEVQAVENYMTNGGTVLLSLYMDTNGFTNLQSLLSYYGVRYDGGVLCEGDASHTVGDNKAYILSDYEGKSIEWPFAVPIYTDGVARNTTTKTVLAATSSSAYCKATDSADYEQKPGDATGSFPLLLKVEDKFEGNTGTMYLFAATYFYHDIFMTGSSAFANRAMLIDCLNEIAGATEDVLSIPDTTALEEALRMSTNQRNRIAAASFILPVLILFAGVVVILRRRVEHVIVTEKGEE
ncbi:MAG: GldG family protein [Lachnospiraceae bacterium]|nr:GldG family protein [Lachnospiraceae bacterium]